MPDGLDPNCRDCGGTRIEGLGPSGNWDGAYAGGLIYQARCEDCGTVWTGYGWGQEVGWGKEGSATDPPRPPAGALVNPTLQVSEGQLFSGEVVNVAEFGLFVAIVPRLDGLLLFDRTPYPVIARRLGLGDTIEVRVRAVDAERVKVYLELLPDPTRYEALLSQAQRPAEQGATAGGGE
jgi:hypothetical protein